MGLMAVFRKQSNGLNKAWWNYAIHNYCIVLTFLLGRISLKGNIVRVYVCMFVAWPPLLFTPMAEVVEIY